MSSLNPKSLSVFFEKDSNCLTALSVFILLLVSPIIYWGIPDGYDLPQHFQFAQTFYDGIRSGNIFLSWSANTNYGFGDVGIRFYPPLAHYSLAITQLFTGDWQTSTWLNIFFWMLLASIGSYFFAREWHTPQNSLLVGILYAIAPYHLAQIYQFFLYSEFVGAAILPFCFLFLTRVCRSAKFADSLKLGFVCALMILSHIPTTIISFICLGIYTLIILDWKKIGNILPKLLLSGFFTLSLTSFYWLKLITELNLVNHSSPQFSTGLYGYKDYFFPMFFNSYEMYLVKQMWFKDIVSIVTIIFLLPLVFFLIWKFRKTFENKEYLALGITGCFSFFMSSSLSTFLWANLSFLQKIQFPFRWLSVATLLGVLSFVLILQIPSSKLFQIIQKYTLTIFFVALSLFNLTQIILPAGLLTQESFAERLFDLRDKESFDCWWTVWSDKKAFEIKEKVSVLNRTVKINLWEGEKREFEVGQGEMENARIATFYYPQWQATVNGEKIEVVRNADGTISIPLTSDAAKISLIFNESNLIKGSKLFTLLSWTLLLLLFIGSTKIRYSSNKLHL